MSNQYELTDTSSDWKNRFAQHASNAPTPETFTANTIVPPASHAPVMDRQDRITGFDQETASKTEVLLVGAGALGSEIGHGLVRKGIGTLAICDEDIVEASNLARQRFFEDDLNINKAIALAKNLAKEGTTGTRINAYPYHFQDAIAHGITFAPDVVVCAPDNDAARLAVADHFYGETPVVFIGLDQDANGGYVFVQARTGPCFRCFRPDAGGSGPCPGTPAVIDTAKVAGGLALFAIDSLVMERYRAWNLTEFYLSGDLSPDPSTVEERRDCSACGGST